MASAVYCAPSIRRISPSRDGWGWPSPWTSAAARRRLPPLSTGGNLRAVAARRRHPSPHASVRSTRAGGCEARPVRGLGDAGPVRGHPPGARGGPHERRHVRRLAYGRDRDERAAGRGAPPAPALERCDEDRGARCAVLRALPRGRRCPRRSVHIPAGAGALPDRHERVEPREGPRLVPRTLGRFRRRGRGRARALGDARRAGTRRPRGSGARGRGSAACRRACGRRTCPSLESSASPAARAIPARTAWSC